MRNRFDQQLAELNRQLIEMGSLCEKALNLTADALSGADPGAVAAVPELENEIDEMERSIESLCLRLLLQQQPVARDLRQISAALKMITDMERIGDQALDISELVGHLGPGGMKSPQLEEMARTAIKMVTDSVDAYVRQDVELAEDVINRDDVVDSLFVRIRKAIIDIVSADGESGEAAVDLIMTAKYFERIGDHATNIAEWVVFSVTGIHKGESEL